MRDATALLASLTARYAANGAAPAPAATLASAGVDTLDLPMLTLDIEDAFGIEIAEDAIGAGMTLAAIARMVEAEVAAHAGRPRRSLVPISCRPWMERAAA
ncbi:MAG: hypothetical protein NW223_07905 [Hyphomicrobiaceae bacterium]|nr:hypothetical protein [Hyphomicrobiaceae bacterium]